MSSKLKSCNWKYAADGIFKRWKKNGKHKLNLKNVMEVNGFHFLFCIPLSFHFDWLVWKVEKQKRKEIWYLYKKNSYAKSVCIFHRRWCMIAEHLQCYTLFSHCNDRFLIHVCIVNAHAAENCKRFNKVFIVLCKWLLRREKMYGKSIIIYPVCQKKVKSFRMNDWEQSGLYLLSCQIYWSIELHQWFGPMNF